MRSLPPRVELVEAVEHTLEFLCGCDEVGDAEVVGAWFLLEAATRYRHNSCLVN